MQRIAQHKQPIAYSQAGRNNAGRPKHIHTIMSNDTGQMKSRDELFWALWLSIILAAVSFPVTMAQWPASCNVSNSSSPRILEFDFSPNELILDNASLTISFQTQVADDNGDINSIVAVFLSPSKNQSIAVFMNSANLLSGDAKNGNYTTNMSFSPSSEMGFWTLDDLIVCDKPGDCSRLDKAAAETLGFPAKLLVIKNAENSGMTNSSALQESSDVPARQRLDLDPDELRGWANTEKGFFAQRKIIINSVFNRPAICWP